MTLALSPAIMSAFAREVIKTASEAGTVASGIQRASEYLKTPEGRNALKIVGALGGGMAIGRLGHKMHQDYKRGRQMRLQHEYAFHDGGF